MSEGTAAAPGPPTAAVRLARALRPFARVEPDEAVSVALLALTVFMLLLGYYLLKTAREPLILLHGGAEVKSYASAGQSLLLLLVIPAYAALARRVGRVRLLVSVYGFFISNLLVFAAQYDAPSAQYLTRTLVARRDAILRRYLTQLSPLADVHVRGREVCGIDLARRTHAARRTFAASARLLEPAGPRLLPVAAVGDESCVELPPLAAERSQPVYGIVENATGSAARPLRAHVYDRGAAGLWLAGIERDR